jgi:hypothetical protein
VNILDKWAGNEIAVVGQHFIVNKSFGYIKKSEGKIRECIKASSALHVNMSFMSP